MGGFTERVQFVGIDVGLILFLKAVHQHDALTNSHCNDDTSSTAGSLPAPCKPELEDPAAEIGVVVLIHSPLEFDISDAKAPRKSHEWFRGKYPGRSSRANHRH